MNRILLLSAVSSLSLAQSALANEEIRAAEDFNFEAEVISVFATQNPIEPFDYPGQVTVIGREEILDFNASTLADIFQAIPGAVFNNGPRRTGDSPQVRGLSDSGVLIFLDGARQSFVSGHDGRFFVDPELVQAVEVVRGPTSALYGSGALGGVIATRTVTAQDLLKDGETFSARLNTGFQSVNSELRAGATAAWQSDDGFFDVVGHMTYRESGNIALGNDFTLPDDNEILSSLLKVTLRPADDLEVYGSWIRFGSDATDPQNPQGVNVAGPGNSLVFRDTASTTLQGGLTWAPKDNALIDMNLIGYYTNNTVEEDEVETPRTVDRRVKTFGITLNNRSTVAFGDTSSVIFTYGAEYFQDEQTGLDNDTADGSRGGVPDAKTDFYGLFVQADLSITNLGAIPGELNIIPGIRWDKFKTDQPNGTFNIDEDAVSPKIGVSYKPIPEFLLFGNWAEGFRAPSFNEAFADGTHFNIPNLTAPPGPFGPQFVANLFVGNPNLRPEQSSTWEFGAGVELDGLFRDEDTVTLKGSYYTSDVDDLIGLDVNTPLGCFVPMFAMFQPCGTGPEFGNFSQNVNIRNAEISGVEIEFSYDSDVFYARGNFTTINGRDVDTEDFLEGALQPNILFVDAGLKFPSVGLRTGARLTAAGTFDEVNTPQEVRDNYTRGDIYAVWEPQFEGLDGIRLDLGVDNVTDADYEVVNAGVAEPGRNFKIALSWTLGF
jgi:hemoglobin/transferrin/lactoferrin receptor protein